jgi:dynein assembly factor 5
MSVLNREINILNEATSDRSAKKGALERILKHAQSKENLDVLAAQILKPLLGAVVDPIEKCRELSMAIITMYIFISL